MHAGVPLRGGDQVSERDIEGSRRPGDVALRDVAQSPSTSAT